MSTFIATFFVLLSVVLLMAVGYIFQRKTVSGSCGGIASVGVEKVCDCPNPCDKRKARMEKAAAKKAMLEEHRII